MTGNVDRHSITANPEALGRLFRFLNELIEPTPDEGRDGYSAAGLTEYLETTDDTIRRRPFENLDARFRTMHTPPRPTITPSRRRGAGWASSPRRSFIWSGRSHVHMLRKYRMQRQRTFMVNSNAQN